MLKFHGIQMYKGIPERFKIQYHLFISLQLALNQLELHEENVENAIQSIKNQVQQIFKNLHTNSKGTREYKTNVSQHQRAIDILVFLGSKKEIFPIKSKIASILLLHDTIENKWKKVQGLLVRQIELLIGGKDLVILTSDPNSDIHKILQMVILFFLDQNVEIPPPNLLMKFVFGAFPLHTWSQISQIEGAYIPLWTPKNKFCRLQYLAGQLLISLGKKPYSLCTKEQKDAHQKETGTSVLKSKNKVIITFKYSEPGRSEEQLLMIPNSPSESLVEFQKNIRQKYTYEGVRHFFGILRQISNSPRNENCLFDVKKHLLLLSKPNRLGIFPEKQVKFFYDVLCEFKNLNVIRTWETYQSTNALAQQIGIEEEANQKMSNYPIIKLLLDKLFLPSANNFLSLGSFLSLMPSKLFKENIRQHAILPSLSAYFSCVWLSEFKRNYGVTEKTAEEIIEGSMMTVSKTGKYRVIHKLKSELSYMEQRKYISKFSINPSSEKNPWKDRYKVSASADCMLKIKGYFNESQVLVGENE